MNGLALGSFFCLKNSLFNCFVGKTKFNSDKIKPIYVYIVVCSKWINSNSQDPNYY